MTTRNSMLVLGLVVVAIFTFPVAAIHAIRAGDHPRAEIAEPLDAHTYPTPRQVQANEFARYRQSVAETAVDDYKFSVHELQASVGTRNFGEWRSVAPVDVRQFCGTWRVVIVAYQQAHDPAYRDYRDLTLGEAMGIDRGKSMPVSAYCSI